MAQSENDDGFNVVEEMPPSEWANHQTDSFGEYVHLVPDPEAGELRCYRSVSEPTQENQRIKTAIERVKFSFYWEKKKTEVNHFYLTGQEAGSFLTFIDLLERGRESSVGFSWWEESGMPMMEEEATGVETINLRFTKPSGGERRMQITSAWQCPTHKMADIEGEGF